MNRIEAIKKSLPVCAEPELDDQTREWLDSIQPLSGHVGRKIKEQAVIPTRVPLVTSNQINRELCQILGRSVAGTPPAFKNYAETVQYIFQQEFSKARKSLLELTPYRIKTVTRFVRALAGCLGLLEESETLEMADQCHKDKGENMWTVRVPTLLSKYPEMNRIFAELLRYQESYGIPPGMSLLPPPVPVHLQQAYQIEQDRELRAYVETVYYFSQRQGMSFGTAEDPEAGLMGLLGLMHEEWVRMAFPSPEAIMAWDNFLVSDLTDVYLAKSWRFAETYAKRKYGLSDQEVTQSMAIVKDLLPQRFSSTLEADRAVMIQRLENLIERCQEGLDLRAELGTLKQLCLVLGLTKAETNNEFKTMINIITETAKERTSREQGDTVLLSEDQLTAN